MPGFGDNPFDDGLDFVGCPPKPTKLRLPEFPQTLKGECKLICWGWCNAFPDGERPMQVTVDNLKPDPNECGAYLGEVHFTDSATGDVWYKGRLRFHYTRNFHYTGTSARGEKRELMSFRFVAKGDIVRVSDKMPEWECLILCTKKSEKVKSYERIFVYGGLDMLLDVEYKKVHGFALALGHNDGWYTHHPKCSRRPIDWSGLGDYIGHYCERGWLFVSPGRNFVFDPGIRPPTGRFLEEALRETGKDCHTEEGIRYGAFALRHVRCIHSYQELKGMTECETSLRSAEFCQGMVYSGRRRPWITFFSMGYWMDRYEKQANTLHLVEGNIEVQNKLYEEKYGKELYFYGFATQDYREELKLVDLASNKGIIGEPADTQLLLYLYNVGAPRRNPRLIRLVPIEPKLSLELLRQEVLATKEKEVCPFLEAGEKKRRDIKEQKGE
jgi:hypothetical protein